MKIKIMLACILALPLTGLIPETLGVNEFKVSEYGAGHQIWFEAENCTSRTSDWAIEEINNDYEKNSVGLYEVVWRYVALRIRHSRNRPQCQRRGIVYVGSPDQSRQSVGLHVG